MAERAWLCRPPARRWRCATPDEDARAFHETLPGYLPSPLLDVPDLADELGVGRLFVKDESGRLGLGSFKVLGASWAVARLLGAATFDQAVDAARTRPTELVTATDGNHGRALAWLGSRLGVPVRVFVPSAVTDDAVAAIAAEGAAVTVVDAAYDEVVQHAAGYAAGPGRELVQDTAWPGYTETPARIVAGYATIAHEADAQLRERQAPGPHLLAVPVGVGSLAQAMVTHYRCGVSQPAVLSVEPDSAACVLASLREGTRRAVPTGRTVMAGLNCGTPSSLAWPVLLEGLDAATTVSDEDAVRASTDLRALGVRSGASGAATLAGLRAALTGPDATTRRSDLGIDESSVVVMLNTEGLPQDRTKDR